MALTGMAATEPPRVLRVGFPQQPGLTQTDENGKHSGYTYDYLMEIAQFNGWAYEFVTFEGMAINDSLQKMLDMLEAGELDLIGALRKNDALLEKYSYPAQHYGTSSVALWAKLDQTEITQENFYYVKDLRIAAFEHATRQNTLLDYFCKANQLSPAMVYVNHESELDELLQTGKADLAIGRDISPMKNAKIICKFSPEPFYFATTKGNTKLMEELDSALVAISQANPSFHSTTYNQYFMQREVPSLVLTEEEKRFIQTQKPLTIGLMPDMNPLFTFDERTQTASGILIDVLNRISKDTGLTFVYKSAKTVGAYETLASEGAFDIVTGFTDSYENAMRYQVIMTPPLLSVPYVHIQSTEGSKASNSYGLPQRLEWIVEGWELGSSQLRLFPTSKDLLDAIAAGEIASGYLEGYVASQLLSEHSYSTLVLTPYPGDPQNIVLGVRRQMDPNLLKIFTKAMRAIPKYEMNSWVYQNMLEEEPMSLGRLIAFYPLQSMGITALFFALILGMLILYLRRMMRLKNEMAARAQCDTLTGLYNLYAFRQHTCKSEADGGLVEGGAFFIMDIDKFKNINDRFGHFEGNNVLKAVATGLRACMDDADLVGRLGGDEFMIYAPKLQDRDQAALKCDLILKRCAEISTEMEVTLSIGVVLVTSPTDFDCLYQLADVNMYQVKRGGRNHYFISKAETEHCSDNPKQLPVAAGNAN
ncbi:MAG: diguanylate cyclase [Clostridia bacterium]